MKVPNTKFKILKYNLTSILLNHNNNYLASCLSTQLT